MTDAIALRHLIPRPGEQILLARKPIGVVGVITPFNFPIAIPAWKIAPALVYGNTVDVGALHIDSGGEPRA